MEIKDLAGISQPLTKLIEVISAGAGRVSESYLIKQRAKAKAEEIEVISSALHKVSQENGLPVEYKSDDIHIWQKPEDRTLVLQSTDVQQRSNDRLDYQERKRQDNIENITSVAAAELVHETTVPDKQIDEDWIARFFESAQNISSEQMQDLWGRILSGEIKKPGSYSLKALDLIRNLSSDDSVLIEKMGRFALKGPVGAFIEVSDKEWLQKKRNIYVGHHFKMAELGLLYPTDLALRSFYEKKETHLVYRNSTHALIIEKGDIEQELSLPIWKYTD